MVGAFVVGARVVFVGALVGTFVVGALVGAADVGALVGAVGALVGAAVATACEENAGMAIFATPAEPRWRQLSAGIGRGAQELDARAQLPGCGIWFPSIQGPSSEFWPGRRKRAPIMTSASLEATVGSG